MIAHWNIEVGGIVKRTELHDEYGGRRQGGISPSSKSPNVMIFSSDSGHAYGYRDGWVSEDVFHYTGEGQRGDQVMRQGNFALLNAKEKGNAIRLFSGSSGIVEYVGEFEVVDHFEDDALDVDQLEMRKVIVFRLRHTGPVARRALPDGKPRNAADAAIVDTVPPENKVMESFTRAPMAEVIAQRTESALVERYLEFRIRRRLGALERLKIVPPGETQPLYTDLYCKADRHIFEAKGTVTREALRMAIGQLLDYKRFVDGEVLLSVLVPSRPRDDLRRYLATYNVGYIYEDGADFKTD